MNADQAVDLCRYVSAACPQQKFDEFTPDVWLDLLEDVPFALARRAAVEVVKAQPFASPAEIRRVVGRMRTLTRRAVRRVARDRGLLVNVEAEADAAILSGRATFDGLDLLALEDQETRFYHQPAAELAEWIPARGWELEA